MTWVEGSLDRTFIVRAPYEAVVEFFCSPEQFRVAMPQLESADEIEPGTWRWVLQEKNEKGVRFRGDYTVRYEREGDVFTWSTSDGNMRTTGRNAFRDLGGGRTEVVYEETLSCDLPIPKLMAKVFKPIVSREVADGIGEFLDLCQDHLEAQHG